MKNVLLQATVLSALPAVAAAMGGAVYTQTNDDAGNALLAWDRDPSGALSFQSSTATGGLGLGAGLGSQGSVVLSEDGRWLLVANAGSEEVSVFDLSGPTPGLVDVEPSLGVRPTSIALRERLVYVLNAGTDTDAATLNGFFLSSTGDLEPLAGPPVALSEASPAPAQVAFHRPTRQLVVTERATNLIGLFPVRQGGSLGAPTFVASAGATPFGFEFGNHDTLLVSEAFGGADDASALSSYAIGDGALTPVSPSVPTTETAACWVVRTVDGTFAYATNTGSGTVSGYAVEPTTGVLAALDADGVTADLGDEAAPIDAAFSRTSRHLYVLSPPTGEIAAFALSGDGSLTEIAGAVAIPATAYGLAAN